METAAADVPVPASLCAARAGMRIHFLVQRAGRLRRHVDRPRSAHTSGQRRSRPISGEATGHTRLPHRHMASNRHDSQGAPDPRAGWTAIQVLVLLPRSRVLQ